MKAPARLGGAVPPATARSSAPPHRWRRALLRTIGIVVAVLALLAAMALLDQAEGDLRQVLAPALDPLATALG